MRTTAHRFWTRAHDKVVGKAVCLGARFLYRRPLHVATPVPIISFTFDDFPRSALLAGGSILNRFGTVGTYYAALGLMGKQGPPGTMFLAEDLPTLLEDGHELGCHTFNHCHSWKTQPATFERSILENRRTLNEILPGFSFKTFAYPISLPRPGTKRMAGRHYLGCRGGGQTFNAGVTDLNCLSAYFLEQSHGNLRAVKNLIDENSRARGWLILATHDVCDSPSPYGCTPDFFEDTVRYAVNSGARILTVARACELLLNGSLARGEECSIRPPVSPTSRRSKRAW